ncbi:MAG: hypothetical protein WBP85_00775 [Terracidiphilus sp.]
MAASSLKGSKDLTGAQAPGPRVVDDVKSKNSDDKQVRHAARVD